MSSDSRQAMGRREFLIVSSTLAIAAGTLGPKLFAGEVATAPKRLALGYAAFEENASVLPAASIPAGDGAFIGRGALISLSGLSGVPANPAERHAVELTAHYSYLEGSERRLAPFRAWGCNRASGCQGSPVRFTVPVDETQTLVFSVGTEHGKPTGTPSSRREAVTFAAPESSDALPVTLTVASGEGTKLVRGFYVIVPQFDDVSDPRWAKYSLKNLEGRMALVDSDGTVADFEHFVLRIDYAS